MKKIALLLAVSLATQSSFAQLQVENLLCENLPSPIGIDVSQPRFTWQLLSNKRNVVQTGYEIRVGNNASSLANGSKLMWESGKINSDSSVHVEYKGLPLQSATKYFWQVRVWDNLAEASSWSKPATFQTAFLHGQAGWKANWIQPGFVEDSINRPTPLFRKEFRVSGKIQSATAYITAHGMYEGYMNGKRIGDFYLTPGWTSYNKRLQYQTYDVTSLLNHGSNTIAIALGSGWYRGHLAWSGTKNVWGNDIALLYQLDITYADGSRESIVSDGSWKTTTGSITYSEIYNGETIDARKQRTGWRMAGYDDKNWDLAVVRDYDKSNLVAMQNEPIRKHETFSPIKIFTTPKGEKVIDFGQNLVGWVMMKAKGNAGDTITISHAEVLDKEGNFYTENLRAARAEAKYVLRGEGEEWFEPHFTFFGFRYIKVEGYPGEMKPDNFTAVALYSDMEPTGTFSCSDALINQLQHNIQWGQKGNFLDVPTDCPQRDERLGWTGDAQVFSRTASFNMNVNNFFAKWLKDVAADQFSSGSVPFVIPNVLGERAGGSTGWADVCTIIPWNMYLAYGDETILQQQYNSMKAWVDYITSKSKNDLWNTGFHFGDWLFYRPFDDNDGRSAVTDKYLIAQCFYAYSTQLLIKAARVLRKTQDVTSYSALLQRIKDAFLKEYVTPNGRLVSSTQTAYVLALNFDMLPESQRDQAAAFLADNVKRYDDHLTTGFLGTPYLCHVLTRFGYDTVAYKLLFQKTYPSWLYPVKMGATTIWERWDGIKPDSTFETPTMNSFNHYSYGAIGDWMYRAVAGIDTYEDAPGYKHIKIQPHLTDSLIYANADLKTYYGTVSSHWKRDHRKLDMELAIPANTKATVYIPASSVDDIRESDVKLNTAKGIKVIGREGNYVVVEIGSGKYDFVSAAQ